MDIRKKFLTVVAGFAVAALFSACGDDSGSNSSRGEEPSSEVAELELANGKAVVCDDDMEGVVAITADDGYRKCVDGEWIKIRKLEAMKADKIIGQLDDDDDDDDTDAESSSSQKQSSSSKKPSIFDEDDDDNDGDVIPDTDPEPQSCSSSSVIPSEVEGSSSSKGGSGVIPGTDPEPPSEVKADGYYKTNCPEGLDCKYATTTDYLNSSKTYGEILDTRDGQVYKTIEICDKENKNCQTWMAQNLNYAYTGVAFCTSDSTSWCYDDDPSNCATYGRLYTWAAAVDSVAIYKNYGERCGYGNGKFCTRFRASALATAPVRGVCPSGWHLPSNAEWGALYTNVGGAGYAGQKLKANTSLWTSYSGVTNDDSFGFSVLPAGFRNNGGDFDNLGEGGGFWSSTEYENHSNNAWNLYFNYNYDYAYQGSNYKRSAFSVRCLKDSF